MSNAKKRVAIGIGCRKECYVSEIIELIHLALEKSDVTISEVAVLATIWAKEGADSIVNAADALDVPLVVISKTKCEEVAGLVETISEKVVELFAVPSVAEIAALAAAGKNPQLICSRIISPSASCAIAVGDEA